MAKRAKKITSEAAATLARAQWAQMSPEDKAKRTSSMARAQWAKIPNPKKRSQLMRELRAKAGPVDPEVARARALKAWETRRRNAAKKKGGKADNDK